MREVDAQLVNKECDWVRQFVEKVLKDDGGEEQDGVIKVFQGSYKAK